MNSVGALTLTATLFSQFNVLNFAEMLPLSNEVMIAMTTVSTVFLVLGIVVSMVQPKFLPKCQVIMSMLLLMNLTFQRMWRLQNKSMKHF